MTDRSTQELWLGWQDAARGALVDGAIRSMYQAVDAAAREAPAGLPQGPPVCNASGRCCKFDTYGHRLYVTGLEIAWFLRQVADDRPAPAAPAGPEAVEGAKHPLPIVEALPGAQPADDPAQAHRAAAGPVLPDACRYQVDGLCSTHTVRPLGCRVYFCTPGTEGWQQTVYERFQDELKQLHLDHSLAYRYMEWRAGLLEADRVFAAG